MPDPSAIADSGRSHRQIRAAFTSDTITVYQAYSPELAIPALAAGRFVDPFKRGRMTWVKPSFLWMMHRSKWATKPGQERVLAIEISRIGFEWALAHSSLSHFDPAVHASYATWKAMLNQPVRIQWDPDRNLQLQPISRRAIQIGLGRVAIDHYVDEWVVSILDLTDLAHAIRDRVDVGDDQKALALLPPEQPYLLTPELKRRVGATC